eukprot:gb/GEZN01004358.1/.p1 GENE.gb/GEZN01004358.1/~~gb/GEZN01004358.1/.p1  ORF type:complete len:543 (+),score=71.73 gb/GEZN01004358.1/:56-1684(+)
MNAPSLCGVLVLLLSGVVGIYEEVKDPVARQMMPSGRTPPSRVVVRPNHAGDAAHMEYLKNMPPIREIPDPRRQECKDMAWDFPPELTTTIIMCFYNEELSILKHSVISILDKTMPSMLDEILLMDEGVNPTQPENGPVMATKSGIEAWGIPKVRVIENRPSLGLMKCRMRGSEETSSPSFVVLDSHIECNVGWLEPLLQALSVRGASVIPAIDIMKEDGQFTYVAQAGYSRGNFKWGGKGDSYTFTWDAVPNEDKQPLYIPYKTPVMAGGLFAILKDRWQESGQYDTEMSIWGSENLEMSFREWQCGGVIYCAPCSRVGHVFHAKFPYGSRGSEAAHLNALKASYVWMDEFVPAIQKLNNWAKNENPGDISHRMQLRHDLQCKSFRWFLNEIDPEVKKTLPDAFKHLLETPLPPPEITVRLAWTGLPVLEMKAVDMSILGYPVYVTKQKAGDARHKTVDWYLYHLPWYQTWYLSTKIALEKASREHNAVYPFREAKGGGHALAKTDPLKKYPCFQNRRESISLYRNGSWFQAHDSSINCNL